MDSNQDDRRDNTQDDTGEDKFRDIESTWHRVIGSQGSVVKADSKEVDNSHKTLGENTDSPLEKEAA